jgi:hypothetical protein
VLIDRESGTGDTTISGVDITSLYTEETSLYIGDATSINIDGTQRLLDLTVLINAGDYPAKVELEACGAPCQVNQGDSSIVLAAVNARIKEDEWRLITVESVLNAYVAVQQWDSTMSGVLVATRIDTTD